MDFLRDWYCILGSFGRHELIAHLAPDIGWPVVSIRASMSCCGPAGEIGQVFSLFLEPRRQRRGRLPQPCNFPLVGTVQLLKDALRTE